MHILNYYFTPFAIIMIAFAVFFSQPGRDITLTAFGLLAASFGLNHWLSANTYKLMQYTRHVRAIIVWINLLTSAALFYLLSAYWAPMWLLFLTAPSAAAMFMKRWQVAGLSLAASGLMFLVYWQRSVEYGGGMSSQLLAMAGTQAVFILFFSLFTAAMAETAVKVRDSLR